MFPEGFNFVRGGKLPGLASSPRPLVDMPPTGGRKTGSCDGFSARMMWRDGGAAETYLYSPLQLGDYGDSYVWKYPNGGRVRFIPGKWHQIKQRIVMNSNGMKNGILEAWLDGVNVLSLRDMKYKDSECPSLGINQFYFSTFFGGNDKTWATTKDEVVYFDDFVITSDR